MSTKNSDKNKDLLKELEKTISPVLVVNNSSLKPYVELFEYAPENIYQQPLGSLVGFFEVKEFSDESAYIVNHLTAVLKKEYYINPKRPVTESLDSALHKVNLALSEIARIGNVQWLGKINAAICVLEKNNAHFSVSGNAKIFLHRNQILSEISEDLASDGPEPHPLKTFINVSSGRLEKNDRLLITSEDIFHILPVTEIDKNFQRFEGEKFVQFLKTALSNQMEMIASIVVEMVEPTPIAKTAKTKNSPGKKSEKVTNVFSEATFANSISKNTLSHDEKFDEAIEEKILNDSNYTDKKTGHIYIQGEATDNEKNANSQMHMYQDLAKEKITQGIFIAKNELRKRFSLYKKQLAKKRALREIEKEKQAELRAEEKKRLEEQRVLQEIENEQRLAEQKELERIQSIEQAKIAQQESVAQEALEIERKTKTKATVQEKQTGLVKKVGLKEMMTNHHELSFKEKLERAKSEQQGNAVIDLKKIHETHNALEELAEDSEDMEEPEVETEISERTSKVQSLSSFASSILKKISPAIRQAQKTVSKNFEKIQKAIRTRKYATHANPENSKLFSMIPHFSRIKKLFSKFTREQKIYTLAAFILIFIAPLFIVHFLNKPKAPTIADIEVEPLSQVKILASEKNINFNTNIKNVFANKEIVTSLIASNTPTVITKTSIAIIKNSQPKEFELPTDSGVPIKATYMNDLSLIFIVTDTNKIISFSPVSEKFTQSNNINLSNISQTSFIGTYLTYLYVLDQKANQIYRFPRAEGGFGDKTEWLKDSTSLSGASDMTIDDNIYATANNKVLKFFKGKAAPFTLESSNTPVVFSKIYTTPELQSLYALDTQNSRVVQYGKDGSIIAQFYNEALRDGFSLSVDETNKFAYLATPSGLISISLQ